MFGLICASNQMQRDHSKIHLKKNIQQTKHYTLACRLNRSSSILLISNLAHSAPSRSKVFLFVVPQSSKGMFPTNSSKVLRLHDNGNEGQGRIGQASRLGQGTQRDRAAGQGSGQGGRGQLVFARRVRHFAEDHYRFLKELSNEKKRGWGSGKFGEERGRDHRGSMRSYHGFMMSKVKKRNTR